MCLLTLVYQLRTCRNQWPPPVGTKADRGMDRSFRELRVAFAQFILADIIPNIYSTIVYSTERTTQVFEFYIAQTASHTNSA